MRLFRSRKEKVWTAPGTLKHVGEKKAQNVSITIFDYNDAAYEEKKIHNIEDCKEFLDKPSVKWINVNGIHDVGIIEKIGAIFNIHPLVLEDILHTDQRPKMEDYEEYIFSVLRMLTLNKNVDFEQVSLLLCKNCVITFQEKEGDVFDNARERIRNGKGRMRKMGADYLYYSLIDAVVDNYFVVLEEIGDKIESIETTLISVTTPALLKDIHRLKRLMIVLRKSVWPLRELIGGLQRSESPLIGESIFIYFRDVYDHTIQIIDAVETYRDILSGMLDMYLTTISNKMNSIMKVLTIIATIFIPLTFIAGVYGMNFEYMPELKWKYGYPFALAIMLSVVVVMLIFFRKKKWI
ncbi:MAG: magnesium/cobalt transporter CorA [Pseudomonadota bacterium]